MLLRGLLLQLSLRPFMMRQLLGLIILLLVAASATACDCGETCIGNKYTGKHCTCNICTNVVEKATEALKPAQDIVNKGKETLDKVRTKPYGAVINEAKAAYSDPSGYIRKTIMETTPAGIMAAELGKVR